MKIFLIRIDFADPNKVLLDGFPGKGEFKRFPYDSFLVWDVAREYRSGNVNDDDVLKEALTGHGITENLDIWAKIYDTLREAIIPIPYDDWTESKYQLYGEYLVNPKTKKKINPISLDKKDYYPPLESYYEFTLWKNLVSYVKHKFEEYPVPYNEILYSYHEKFKTFKSKLTIDCETLSSKQYAEFLVYFTPPTYLRLFILENQSLFPYITDLINMYRDGLCLDYEFLKKSWYVIWDGDDRVRYGEEKFRKEMDIYFGNNKYTIINV